MKYIDVSEHQGNINWDRVKGSVEGVIIRAGYGKGNVDKFFHANAAACNKLGIPCGAYWFSYAYTPEMARLEAVQLLQAARQHRMELPLAFDWEYDSRGYAIKHGITPSKTLVQEMTKAFCDEIEAAKYYCMVYTNVDFINQYFGELAGGRYDLWLASWPRGSFDVTKPPRPCGIWQWGGSAVPGINGNTDSNEAMHDYKALIAEHELNGITKRPWYADAQDWARDNGISDGDRPDDAATRAEVWTMLKRFSDGPRYSGLIDE